MLAHRNPAAAAVAAVLTLATACAVPSLHGLDRSDFTAIDEDLLGTWQDLDQDSRPTFLVSRRTARTYDVIARWRDREESREVRLVAGGVRIGDQVILDVTLSEEERKAVGKTYGSLLVPTHEFYRASASSGTLRLLSLRYDWFEGFPGLTHHDAFPVFTGDASEMERILLASLADEEAWQEIGELTRAP